MKKNSKDKIARIYATALYDAAKASNEVDLVKKDVDFLSMVCDNDADLIKEASSPLLSEDEQKDIWQKVVKKASLSKETAQFLDALVENRRIVCLPLVVRNFLDVYYTDNNIKEVVVETVKKLSDNQDKKLKSVLKNKIDGDVVIKYVINPSLLGGLRIQCGSNMYDGSLNYKLNCLENVMKGK